MTHGVYLIQTRGELVRMVEQPYGSERSLQELLAKHPDLLSGDELDDVPSKRWLLIGRELPMPSEENGSGRWSVDHLFIDQDAVPTIVEVKRSVDTRIRREVVGQMLDYAANAVVYWPVEDMRTRFEANCRDQGLDPETVLEEFLGPASDPELFWETTRTNLKAAKVRLVFVADEIPAELQRIVEFMNRQMSQTEVLALELKQYVGSNLKTLVPRVFGRTDRPPTTAVRQWDERSFLGVLEARGDNKEAEVAKRILEWAKNRGLRVWWGRGLREGSFYALLDLKNSSHYLTGVRTGYTSSYIQMPFRDMSGRPPFDAEENRRELLDLLNGIPGIKLPEDSIGRYPSFPLSVLVDDACLHSFLKALDWAADKIESR
ncbi:MAG: hypothetical protein M1531_05635 [Chloroflexi bacterium]|nr:hypothetical protein [Chloroflexota bacterium]